MIHRRINKTVAFTGATNLGAQGSVPIFTVTGTVLIEYIIAKCTEDLASSGGTLALGVTSSTTLFIGATTATTIDNGEFFVSTTPTAKGIAIPAACYNIVIDQNIIGTVASADVTDGTIDFTVFWLPVSKGSSVTVS